MKELIEMIAKALVDSPDEVVVSEVQVFWAKQNPKNP